jgi:hypothetical protein
MTEDAALQAVAAPGVRPARPDADTLTTTLRHFEPAHLRRLTSRQLARLVSRTSRADLDRAVRERDVRLALLGEIFHRMQEHLRPQRAQHMRALVRWRFSGGTGAGGYDRYETLFAYGSCSLTRESPEPPRLTITMQPADFIRLAAGRTDPALLYLSGKIRVRGDVAFAAGLIGFFDLPVP